MIGCISKMLGFLLFIVNIYNSHADDAVQGSTITLACTSSGPKFSWSKQAPTEWIDLSNDNKYGGVDTSQLTIRNIDVTDSLKYLCYGGTYVAIPLNVIVYATRGSTVIWRCPVSGTSYQWQKYEQNFWLSLSNNGKYSNVQTSQITIVNVDDSDNGHYRCFVNGVPSQAIILYTNVVMNGGWSDWSSWTTCSVTCGDGTRTRYHDCNNPPPANGGSYCKGLYNDTGSCNTEACPVNGGWSDWGTWMTCSVTCEVGTSTRYRTCTNPTPANGGSNCLESNSEIGTCYVRTCKDKPLVQSSTQYLQTRVGGDVVIPCSFDSYPEPTNVFWKKDNMTLNSIDGAKYNGSSVKTPSLTIYNINNSDFGMYVCYVENELGISFGKPVMLDVLDASQSASIIGTVAGGVSSGSVAIVLVTVGLLIWTKSRKRSTNKQNKDYETPDIAKVELHLYEERQRHNSNAIELPVHGSTSEILSNKTFKTSNVRDFMELLQDKTSLTRNTKHEYQLLNVMEDLTAAGDYEIIETTAGTVTAKASENKSLIKKQDDGNGYIIRTVPGQSDIDSFWTEIIDFRARNIVLLVHKMEQISEVFPTTDVSVNTSKFNVELASSEKYPNNIFAFCLTVRNKDTKTEVQVKLYKTTDWKVGEKHPSIDTLCKLLDVVSDQESGLVAFLESNDISFRVCGGLGVCHEVFYAIKAERGFNIPQVAVDLKRMRPDLFQTYEEYNLCYIIIGHFLENQTTYAVIA